MLEKVKQEIGKIRYNIENLKVHAFVGSSGTGKSYKAQQVGSTLKLDAIIDDGLLISINESRILAGYSAKKANTKIQTIRDALFERKEQQETIRKALKENNIRSILILGTSDAMVEKIRENLGLPQIIDTTYIEDVSTKSEIDLALKTRKEEGKHVIPVPTFEVKKDFSGILLDPLQMFRSNKGATYVSKKSIIRPTFSYIGKFTMGEKVFRDIINNVIKDVSAIKKIEKIRIKRNEETNEISLYIELIFKYGYNIQDEIKKFRDKIYEEIEEYTQINVIEIDIKIKDIDFE